MTASIGEPPEAPSIPEPPIVAPPASRNVVQSVAPDIHEICPYLAAAGGAWRSASPHREHRCGAVEPPAPLTNEKQRGLCLTAEHAGCATFRAARASRAAMLAPGVDPAAVAAADAARRPIARTSVVVLEHPRLSAPRARWPVDRAAPQAALVALMIVAFIALAVARFSGPDQAGVAVSSPSPTHTASPTARPTARPTASPSVAPSASAAASRSPAPSAAVAPSGAVSGVTATPAPATKTYVVKKGDTLYGIASTFRTTVAEVKRMNGLKDNSLKVGQKLNLP